MADTRQNERERTAYHEAGHAVAYLVAGRTFRYVTIRPRSAGITGQVYVRPRRIDSIQLAVIAHCGPIAEGRFLLANTTEDEMEEGGMEPEDIIMSAYLENGRGDLETVRYALTNYGSCSDVVEEVASAILDKQWGAVNA